MQHIHLRAGKQRVIHLKGRIFGSCANKSNQTLLNKWQKGILLRLIETVYLVHKQDGMAAVLLQHPLCLSNRLADVFDARQHGGQRHELGIEG